MSLKNINPTKTSSWKSLKNHFNEIKDIEMKEMFKNGKKASDFTINWDSFSIDFSKNRINKKTLSLLFDLATECDLYQAIEQQFCGVKINQTERRAVLHTAMRAKVNEEIIIDNQDVVPSIIESRKKIKNFTENILSGKHKGCTNKPFSDVVNIGIGGSDLGPSMIVEALKYYSSNLKSHFISNVDGDQLFELLNKLNAETTLFIIVSKTFTTQETITNANTIKNWLVKEIGKNSISSHFAAVSTNTLAIKNFGIKPEFVFSMNDWVGGRFSLWSSVGLSISLSVGYKNFEKLLNGAKKMDTHFRETEFDKNIPVILALISVWYNNFFKCETEVVIPYSQYLNKLPAYLQQAVMESNGKSNDRGGEKITYQTGNIIWGNTGTNSQHAFFQLIHQGTKLIPSDFIGFKNPLHKENSHHNKLMANFFAQTEALMLGKTSSEVQLEMEQTSMDKNKIKFLLPFKIFDGNRPSNTILIDKLNPESLGSLIAMYEHKIFVQGIIWNIFSYDQWGVELGKRLATNILNEINDNSRKKHDDSTNSLLDKFLKK
jgi:glucose-6-phosphate isomerase